MLVSHPPKFLQRVYSSLVWSIPNESNTIYLTFDDGPTKGVTAEVLDLLSKHNAKATFFCIGKNVIENVEIFERIINEGHGVGNHSQNHLNGWKTNNSVYVKDVLFAAKYIKSNLFRPPYGKIKSRQIKRLRADYKIIMWTVLSRDYDEKITEEECLKLCLTNLKSGSIIVFHDSIKAKKNMLFALTKLLEFAKQNGFNFGIVE